MHVYLGIKTNGYGVIISKFPKNGGFGEGYRYLYYNNKKN